MRKLTQGILLIYIVLGLNSFSNASIMVYTDRTLWEAALGAVTIETETFDNDITAADVIVLDNGIISTAAPGGLAAPNDNAVFGGFFRAYTTPGGFAPESYTWDMPRLIFALGADFVGVNTGQTEININSLGYSALLADTIGSRRGFFGLISDASFEEVVFINDNGGGDSWDMDDFSTVSAVPEPATLLLMGIGLAGLGFAGRRSLSA